MEVQIVDEYLRKLFEGKKIPGKPQFSTEVISKFKKTVLKMQLANSLQDIKAQKGLNFEALKGKLKGYYSVRVDYHYRLLLTLNQHDHIQLTEVILVHSLTNHYQ